MSDWNRLSIRLRDSEVLSRVNAIGALLSMSLFVAQQDESVDVNSLRAALETAFRDARESLIAYSAHEPLTARRFPEARELPRLITARPPDERFKALMQRVTELRRQAQS